ATDSCDAQPVISHSDTPLAANCTGQAGIQRTWKATDASNNEASVVQTITFVDTTAPVITCPANKQLERGASSGPTNTGTASATNRPASRPSASPTPPRRSSPARPTSRWTLTRVNAALRVSTSARPRPPTLAVP